MAAEFATPEAIAFFLHHTSGLICVSITAERAAALDLGPMVLRNTETQRTAFLVSVDLRDVTTTGISAVGPGRHHPGPHRPVDPARRSPATRAHLPAAGPRGRRAEAGRPHRGHRSTWPGSPAAVRPACCARWSTRPSTAWPAAPTSRRSPPATGCDDVDRRADPLPPSHRAARRPVDETVLPTEWGPFRCVRFRSRLDGVEHLAFVRGDVAGVDGVLVRVHSECVAGDVFGSHRCDCGPAATGRAAPHRPRRPRRDRVPARPGRPQHRRRPASPARPRPRPTTGSTASAPRCWSTSASPRCG